MSKIQINKTAHQNKEDNTPQVIIAHIINVAFQIFNRYRGEGGGMREVREILKRGRYQERESEKKVVMTENL